MYWLYFSLQPFKPFKPSKAARMAFILAAPLQPKYAFQYLATALVGTFLPPLLQKLPGS